MTLVEYGIQTEQSDIRAHVGVACRCVFVFRTKAMIEHLKLHPEYITATAEQEGINGITARGILAPIENILRDTNFDMRILNFTDHNWDLFPARTSTTSERGQAAVVLICDLLKKGKFPLWIETTENGDKNIQIAGTDIIVWAKQRIQVKCDWCAGLPEWNPQCTGNLFIQTAERNPLGKI